MDKQDFVWILQSALFHYDGMGEEELIKLGATPKTAKTGIELCNYLKSIKIEKETLPKPNQNTTEKEN